MKGVWRAALLLFTWAPLQRWLMAIGFGLIVASHLTRFVFPLAHVVFLAGLAFMVMPTLCVSGMLLRSIAAPRTIRLIAHARLQMLLGVLMVAAILAVWVTTNLYIAGLEDPSSHFASMSLRGAFAVTLGIETALLLSLFFMGSSPYAVLGVIAFLPILTAVIKQPAGALVARLGITQFIILATALAWSAFTAWFLRARHIRPPVWAKAGQAGSKESTKRRTIKVSRDASIEIHLLGLASMTHLAWRVGIPLLTVLVLTLATFLRSDMRVSHAGAVVLLTGFFVTLLLPAMVTIGITHRSRLLWITGGHTREGLFQTCERLAWRYLGTMIVWVLPVCAAAGFCLSPPAGHWPYLVTTTLAFAICGIYLGLMNVSGWRLIDVGAAVLVVLASFVGVVDPLFTDIPIGAGRLSIPFSGLLGALGLRCLAKRRWQRIDWLICRPARLPSQALRPVA